MGVGLKLFSYKLYYGFIINIFGLAEKDVGSCMCGMFCHNGAVSFNICIGVY